MEVAALVAVTGRNGRIATGPSGAWLQVRGEPLLTHAVRALVGSSCIDHVFVSTPGPDVDSATRTLAGFPATVLEGATEADTSVRQTLHIALENNPGLSVILVHDAMRAFAPPSLIRSVVDTVRGGAQAVLPVLPVADTVKQVDTGGIVLGTWDRAELRALQSPQGFTVRALRAAGASGGPLLDNLDVPVSTIPGHPYAVRIATPFDVTAAEAVFATEQDTRDGDPGSRQ